MKTAVDNKDSSGLARMYNLFSRVAGLKMLCDAFKAHVNVRLVSYLLPTSCAQACIFRTRSQKLLKTKNAMKRWWIVCSISRCLLMLPSRPRFRKSNPRQRQLSRLLQLTRVRLHPRPMCMVWRHRKSGLSIEISFMLLLTHSLLASAFAETNLRK